MANTHRNPNRPLDRQIGISIDLETRNAIMKAARAQGLSISQFVRRAVSRALTEGMTDIEVNLGTSRDGGEIVPRVSLSDMLRGLTDSEKLPPAVKFLLAVYARAEADPDWFDEMLSWPDVRQEEFQEGIIWAYDLVNLVERRAV